MEATANIALNQALQPATNGIDAPERIYSISIRQIDHGYIVEVGCKTFAIENAQNLADMVSAYLVNPKESFTKFYEGKLFKQ